MRYSCLRVSGFCALYWRCEGCVQRGSLSRGWKSSSALAPRVFNDRADGSKRGIDMLVIDVVVQRIANELS